jgi:hypothetical protein
VCFQNKFFEIIQHGRELNEGQEKQINALPIGCGDNLPVTLPGLVYYGQSAWLKRAYSICQHITKNMKAKNVIFSIIVAGWIAVPALVNGAEVGHGRQQVTWKDLPTAVQNTITDNASGGTILKVRKVAKHNILTYVAKVKSPDGKRNKIRVTADGKLVKARSHGKCKGKGDDLK